MQVLFPAAFIIQQIVKVSIHWFLGCKSCKLMRAKANLLFLARNTMFYQSQSPACSSDVITSSRRRKVENNKNWGGEGGNKNEENQNQA